MDDFGSQVQVSNNTPPPAPFLQITSDDRSDAIRSSQLARAILAYADQNLRVHSVKILLDRCGDDTELLNSRDSRGRTPLMHAIADFAIDIIPMLIDCAKIDLQKRDRFGNTALMYAVGHGYENVARLLLNALKKRCNCDDRVMLNYLHMENYDGETALELALKAGHEESALALSEYLNEAMKKEKSRKSSFAYKLGFGKRSPPFIPKMANGKLNAFRTPKSPASIGRRKSYGEGELKQCMINLRKSSD